MSTSRNLHISKDVMLEIANYGTLALIMLYNQISLN